VLDPHAPVSALSPSAQQRVEIVKALARDARVLILDEPTAVLAPGEADDLLRRLRAFADSGRSVILITHKLREALGVADDITVLRRGATTYSAPRAVSTEDALIEAMLGAATRPAMVKRSERGAGAVVIRAHDLVVTDERGAERVKRTSFEIAAGEIVGVAGIEGSGHRELLRALAGRRQPTRAESLRLPRTIGFVPDDRHREAIIPEMSLTENVVLRGAKARRGRIRWPEMASRTRTLIERFDIRAPGPEASMRTLSGGNQQRFVLARELDGPPDVVVVENPTRGLDVRASSDILARLVEARDRGVAVIVYSADLDEVLSLADRVLVVFAGVVRELVPDRELVGRAMLGAA
jgi:simple sugar transport system ATP-binding protein